MSKVIRNILLALFVLCVLSIIVILFVRNKYHIEGQYVIAHAGGVIDDYKYTNSREAVMNSMSEGINYIELDLSLTSDSVLVCAHDWKRFRRMTGRDTIREPLSYQEFISKRIYDKYHPLSAKDVVEILRKNPQMRLVTDKLSTPEILDKYFCSVKNQVVVEAFSLNDYIEVQKRGFLLAFYSGRIDPRTAARALKKGCLITDIVTWLPYDVNSAPLFERLYMKVFGVNKALYSVDSRIQADSVFASDANTHFVYANRINRK